MTRLSMGLDLPDLSTMEAVCGERIVLCGPRDPLTSRDEYDLRHRRLDDLAASWTVPERTDFWYTLDRLCADGNPAVRARPGLTLTPEALAFEDSRITTLVHQNGGADDEIQGFPAWGFYLYTDPVLSSFTADETSRYSTAKAILVLGPRPDSGHGPVASMSAQGLAWIEEWYARLAVEQPGQVPW